MLSLNRLSSQIELLFSLLKLHAEQTLAILVVIWGIHLANALVGRRLNRFGIWPRHLSGLPGIVLSPLLHANFSHLFFNSFPLFILIDFTYAVAAQRFWVITLEIVLLSGSLVWLLGRNAIHLGASGLIMGYWGFLLALAFYQPSDLNIIVVLIMLYYLGGLVTHLVPSDEKVSFEGHIFGAVAGIAVAFMFIYFH